MVDITKEQSLKIEIYDILEKEAVLHMQLKNLNEYKQKKMDELNSLRRDSVKDEPSVKDDE